MFKTLFPATAIAGLMIISSNAHAYVGVRTAQQMQMNYNATPDHCQGNAVPAHACSGILIRATTYSPHYHAWHHSQNSKAKGGVSFSYLRADIPTTRLAADARSGFTLHPQYQRPHNTRHYEVLCAWPTDGDTWTRDHNGCGDNSQTYPVEQACHQQGVMTAEHWMTQFRRTRDYKRQCAFDTRYNNIPGRAENFHQSLRAKRLYGNELPFTWNEVIVRAWDESTSDRLPIQSFFHIDGMQGALEQARANQRDWHGTNGTFIPVIRIRLPDARNPKAQFSYHEDEQAVATPRSAGTPATP